MAVQLNGSAHAERTGSDKLAESSKGSIEQLRRTTDCARLESYAMVARSFEAGWQSAGDWQKGPLFFSRPRGREKKEKRGRNVVAGAGLLQRKARDVSQPLYTMEDDHRRYGG
jgi:hypothetical protein